MKEALRGYGSLRGDLLDLAGLVGCLAFKRAMPQAGEAYALTVLEGLQYLGPEETDWLDKGFSALRNIANTACLLYTSYGKSTPGGKAGGETGGADLRHQRPGNAAG